VVLVLVEVLRVCAEWVLTPLERAHESGLAGEA
jgi:hypothetical protein